MPEYIELEALAAPFDAITVECNGETFVRALDIQNFILGEQLLPQLQRKVGRR